MVRVDVKPAMLRWARERAGLRICDLTHRAPLRDLPQWEREEAKPTLEQLERFARATNTPIGYLFLPEPPDEPLPIPDMRVGAGLPADRRPVRPSPSLLETIYVCQQRQAWYGEFAVTTGEAPRSFVGSVRRTRSVEAVAAEMRETLGFDVEDRRACSTWTAALRQFIGQADALGVLVMASDAVLNDTLRKLDPAEFRGFALANDLAPLVFINAADAKSAQMFTLAHALAHIWLGQSALDDATPAVVPGQESGAAAEAWCNQVAAELLVPLSVLKAELGGREDLAKRTSRLARRFKVSTLVVLRRLHDAGTLSKAALHRAYEELGRSTSLRAASGRDVNPPLLARVGERFARALVVSTLEGQTLYRDAFQMLGISKVETLQELGRSLEIHI